MNRASKAAIRLQAAAIVEMVLADQDHLYVRHLDRICSREGALSFFRNTMEQIALR